MSQIQDKKPAQGETGRSGNYQPVNLSLQAAGDSRGKRPKAYAQVAQSIRRQVLTGGLAKGERLPPERELADAFGVSRMVVREAIRALESDGLLQVRPGAGGGSFVTHDFDKPLGASINNLLAGGAITLDNLFELRLMLEAPAAAMAAVRGRRADIEDLARVVEQADDLADDSEALRAANLEFHRRLVALAGNPLLSSLCETVLAILVKSLQGRLNVELSRRVLEYHHHIVGALLERRAEDARRLTAQDLEQLHQRYNKMGIRVDVNPEAAAPAAGGREIS